ncbi:MAG TPA: LysE family transporter [Stellaceae bacterium]|nr:LysE family transporter [Stellaceae bacterium]
MPETLLYLVKGVVVGMVIAVPVGPVGVLCVRRTFFEGALFGILSGVGAATADVIFGITAGLGLTVVRDWLLGYQEPLGALGGLYLLFIGMRALFKRGREEPQPITGENLAASFASTFALTITNPITILAFAAIFAKVGFERESVALVDVWVMVGGVFLGSLLWWLGLSFGITALRRFAHMTHLDWVNRVSGTVLVLSGAGLLVSVALNLAGFDF